jgi:hypothetical protein
VLTDVDCAEEARLAPKRSVHEGRDQYHSPQLLCSDFRDSTMQISAFPAAPPCILPERRLVFTCRLVAVLTRTTGTKEGERVAYELNRIRPLIFTRPESKQRSPSVSGDCPAC